MRWLQLADSYFCAVELQLCQLLHKHNAVLIHPFTAKHEPEMTNCRKAGENTRDTAFASRFFPSLYFFGEGRSFAFLEVCFKYTRKWLLALFQWVGPGICIDHPTKRRSSSVSRNRLFQSIPGEGHFPKAHDCPFWPSTMSLFEGP